MFLEAWEMLNISTEARTARWLALFLPPGFGLP